jgi:hypothetical protein
LGLQRCLELENVGNNLLPGLNARQNLLPVAVQHATAVNFNAPELVSTGRDKDPVAVMQVQYRGGGDDGIGFFRLALEGAVTNIPNFRMPGFGTSMRTLAVRMLGSSTGPMSLMWPLNTLPG